MMSRDGFENVVGLDPSATLLLYAKSRLGAQFHPVIGIAEHLPFRAGSLGAVITCFALRDAVDYDKSVEEFARTTRRGGALAVVDIGKPDGAFSRSCINFYIAWVMPVLARFWVRGRARGNPFKMIIPTWKKLYGNKRVEDLIEQFFGPCASKSFLLGGLVLFEADRFSVPNDILRQGE